ncbi:hypothetical protein DRO59_00305 [Candidatus Bathyarchaeota archaeon]|nr:MAG: hypothetical protein DRO59_00305 [Candidatus Bathyarchaeota archaeon]
MVSLRRGWTADGWKYWIDWSDRDGKFRVSFANEFKEVWILDDLSLEFENGRYAVFYNGVPISEEYSSRMDAVDSAAGKIAYRLEHDGSWIVRGERAKEKFPKEVRVIELPFGRTRLVFEKAVPVVPMAIAALERERRAAERPVPKPPKPKPKKVKLGLTSGARRKLRVMYENFLYKSGIKPTSRLLTDFYFFLDILEKRLLTLPEETAFTEAKRETVNYFKKVYFKHYGL